MNGLQKIVPHLQAKVVIFQRVNPCSDVICKLLLEYIHENQYA